MSAGPGTDSGLWVPFLVDPDHEDLARHIENRRFFWLDLQGPTDEQLHNVATIFLPLTFLTGFFGQNFSFLTEHLLNSEWSFVVFGVGLLLVSIVVFVVYFRRKRWK